MGEEDDGASKEAEEENSRHIMDLEIEEDDERRWESSVCNSDRAVGNSSRAESKAAENETPASEVPVEYSRQPVQSDEELQREANAMQVESLEGLTGQSARVQLPDDPHKSGRYNRRKYGRKHMKSQKGSQSYYRCKFSGRFAKKIEGCVCSNCLVETVHRSPHNHHPKKKANYSRESKPSSPVVPVNKSIVTKHPVRCINDPVPSTPSKESLLERDAIHERKQHKSSGFDETTEIIMEEHADGPKFKRRQKRNFTQILSLSNGGHTLGPLCWGARGGVVADHPCNPDLRLLGGADRQICFPHRGRGWPWANKENHQLFVDWYECLKPSFESRWRQVGIAEALSICIVPCEVFPIDLNLIFAATCFWDTYDNTFHFSVGPMTITLLDLEAIGGFSSTGICVDPAIQWGPDLPEIRGHYKSTTGSVMKYNVLPRCFLKPDLPISDEEHIRFLAFWLCRYCCCPKAIQVTLEYFRVATALAFGKKVALGPIVLANIYRGLALLQKYRGRVSPPTLTGALWVVGGPDVASCLLPIFLLCCPQTRGIIRAFC